MILGHDLFGREVISPVEKKIIKSANKTASDLFKKRFSPALADNWDIDVNQITLKDIEKNVIEAILSADKTGGKKIWRGF